jgi:hypothetical protein
MPKCHSSGPDTFGQAFSAGRRGAACVRRHHAFLEVLSKGRHDPYAEQLAQAHLDLIEAVTI